LPFFFAQALTGRLTPVYAGRKHRAADQTLTLRALHFYLIGKYLYFVAAIRALEGFRLEVPVILSRAFKRHGLLAPDKPKEYIGCAYRCQSKRKADFDKVAETNPMFFFAQKPHRHYIGRGADGRDISSQ